MGEGTPAEGMFVGTDEFEGEQVTLGLKVVG
jgi:hypothetical protein